VTRPGTLIAFLGLLASSACGAEGPARPPMVGDAVPAYAATELRESGAVSLGDLRGRVVLLNIWATWCPPCREEIPVLQALHEAHAADGLEVVGVSVDAAGEAAAVARFVDQVGVTYPIWLDPQERVSSVFRTTGVPTTMLIDRQGTLVWRHVGPVAANDPELTRLIAESLATELGDLPRSVVPAKAGIHGVSPGGPG
jgi:cytochrome c biogenesis protein CcmG/thiol:disulfide interchange protein DsbE